eukprot:2107085-Prorocentrum_lima.AAC.1
MSDGLNHRCRIGEAGGIGIDETAESGNCQSGIYQFCVRIVVGCFPFFAATLQQPHATDVFQEP